MSPDEINREIAMLDHWHGIVKGGDGQQRGMCGPMRAFMRIPDYCGDEEIMHDLEKRQIIPSPVTVVHYVSIVYSLWQRNDPAPARVRAEAFLLLKEKYRPTIVT